MSLSGEEGAGADQPNLLRKFFGPFLSDVEKNGCEQSLKTRKMGYYFFKFPKIKFKN